MPGVNRDPDYWRQLDVFAPSEFKRPVTVIGAGATGSYVAWLLAKMGCKDITVYDHDDVENHNLPNQIYGPADVGTTKVAALAKSIKEATGISVKGICERVTDGLKIEQPGGVVFLLTDSMESRKQIWESAIKYKLNVDLMVETRMGTEGGRVYAVHPSSPKEVEAYEKTLYTDGEAQESPCTNQAIAPSAAIIAGYGVSAMLNFVRGKSVANETLLSFSPFFMQAKKF